MAAPLGTWRTTSLAVASCSLRAAWAAFCKALAFNMLFGTCVLGLQMKDSACGSWSKSVFTSQKPAKRCAKSTVGSHNHVMLVSIAAYALGAHEHAPGGCNQPAHYCSGICALNVVTETKYSVSKCCIACVNAAVLSSAEDNPLSSRAGKKRC